MPLNKDDIKGGLNRTKRPAPRLSRKDAKAAVHAYRATGTLPSATFADPIATLPVKHPATLEQDVRRSRTTAPPGSAQAALIDATGGSYAFDRAPMRPEDVATVRAFHRATGSPSSQLDTAAGFALGVKPSTLARVVQHPLRFAEQNRKEFEASGYRSADLTPTGLIAASPFVGAPVASKITKTGAAKGLETRFAGGGAKKEDAALPAGAKELTDRLGGAARLRAQQDKLGKEERARRLAEYGRKQDEGLAAGLDPAEAHRIAMQSLSGELPKLEFTAGREISGADVPGMYLHIKDHPELREWEKIRTKAALEKVFNGATPQPSEIKLLAKAFGENDAAQLAGSVEFWKQARDAGLSLINVPRALKSSFDVSAPFRQGLVLGARHPRMFASELKPMMKALKSEGAYQAVMDDIATRPTFQTMRDAKLALTDLESISTREEQFMSNIAEKIPVFGRGVRASGRAYVVFLNKFRADAFDNYLRMAEANGKTLSDKDLHAIASWVNHATGRGTVKGLESAMPALNAMFFSPRLIASRLQLLNPVYYGSLTPFARKQAMIGMRNLVAGVSLTLYMAHLAGAQVGLDRRSANFGKIRVGNTRVDIMGGFQQYIVAATRLIKGEMVSSTSGELVKLQGGLAKPSRNDIAMNFLEGKLAPVPRFLDQWSHNENDNLQPFKPLHELPWLFAPLGPQNALQTYQQEGPAAAAVGLGLGSIGFGVQTYGAQDKAYKDNIKEIAKAVKDGRIDQATAEHLKQQNDVTHQEWLHEQSLLKGGHSQQDVDRALVIEYAKKNSMPAGELENLLKLGGYKPLHDGEYR